MYILGKLVSLKRVMRKKLDYVPRENHHNVYLQLATLHSIIADLNDIRRKAVKDEVVAELRVKRHVELVKKELYDTMWTDAHVHNALYRSELIMKHRNLAIRHHL